MAKFDHITSSLKRFIYNQPMFFVATAPQNGRINLSPKGLDSFYVHDENTVYWLNLTGSGNETEAHLQEDSRMTIMFNSYSKDPMILRLYGHAKSIRKEMDQFDTLLSKFNDTSGARQIIEMKVDLVQTSCGFGVPLMDFKSKRETLSKWSQEKGEDGVKDFQDKNNRISLDGKKIDGF